MESPTKLAPSVVSPPNGDSIRYSTSSSMPPVPPPSFFLESLHEASDFDSPSPSSANSSSSNASINKANNQLHINPALAVASGLRRTRAETFSSYNTSKGLKDEVVEQTPPTTAVASGRARAGSLSLPANNISTAFGPSLFATSWQPGQPQTPTTPSANNVNVSQDLMSGGGAEETASLVRTLDLLGLDDALDRGSLNTPQSAPGNMGFSGGGVHALFGRAPGDSSVFTSPTSPSPTTSPSHIRSRSYSMAVGEQLSITIPNHNASSLRPRATSIAYIESTGLDNESMLSRKPANERLARADNSTAIPEESMPHLYMGESSPNGSPNGFGPDSPSNHEQIPTRSLWIGNIDTTISPSDLLSLFSPFGVIESLRILTDKECAFVNYVRIEDAIRARDEMQGSRVGSCIVRVGYGKAESISDNQGMQPTKSLWIGNIPPMTEPAELENIFRVFGPIESARVLTHKNCGFVNYERLEDSMEARKAMNGREIGGSVVKINFAKVPSGVATPGSSPDHERPPYNYIMSTPTRSSSSANARDASMDPNAPSFSPLGARTQGILYAGGGIPTLMGGIPTMTSNGMSMLMGNQPQQQQPPLNGYESHMQASADSLDLSLLPFDADSYASTIPPPPEPRVNRRVDQNRLRDMRKRLEGHITLKEVDLIYQEILEDTVDLCTDYIGNVVIQKIVDKSTDQHRLRLLEKVAPHMAAIGIHKNGTWAVQKMIDSAKTTQQIQVIVTALRAYCPPLLLDQFGNYVVQCCLRLGAHRNQFVFDAMHSKVVDIAQGRFGARAMRACLESQYTTKRQQKHVAIAVVQNSVQLCTNPNGAILITWLLDTSSLPGRFRVLAPKIAPHIAALCTHKLASATILKLVTQRIELDARDVILKAIFFGDDIVLEEILTDQVHGVSVIQKILASACVSIDEKIRLGERTRQVLGRMPELQDNAMGYKRLLDELAVIPSAAPQLGAESSMSVQDIVSPLTPQSSFFAPTATTNTSTINNNMNTITHNSSNNSNNNNNAYFSHLPTPSHSPNPPITSYMPQYASNQFQQPNFGPTSYMGYPTSPPHQSLLKNSSGMSSYASPNKYGNGGLSSQRYPGAQFGSLQIDESG
ncbi:hypothetical protein SmJEL517_g02473 [Synchytrium microbalum]|uniref:PUM-HD domain-containing protein n=1 Tax=Synchytrium microbalum TaxID=1806994 RepID=A0A507CC13_9FUNG|nr:uncharacterized protein SmJEL517_g02473 [Synchytrium microbalum]TPX35105.1 hypothetical protein SmJEL517_g02473 [Synchytrium microbalum]